MFRICLRTGGSNECCFGIRPRHDWTSKLAAYTQFQQLGNWQMLAQGRPLWMQLSDDLLKFCSTTGANSWRKPRRTLLPPVASPHILKHTWALGFYPSCPSCQSCAWRLPTKTVRTTDQSGKRCGRKKKILPERWIAQDSRMEHERTTETRATGLHLGNGPAKILDPERF